MGRLDLDISFKQTTSENIKCRICRESVNGQDGYIKVNLYDFGDSSHWSVDRKIVVCNKCFQEWLDNITTAKGKQKESYNKLVKTKILKSLK